MNGITLRRFAYCKLDKLNSTLLLRSRRALISSCWPGAQRDAGDAASAKATAEQARNTLEPLYKDQQDNSALAENLALLYAVLGNKELALKEAERAIMLAPSAKDAMYGPNGEENLALIQMMVGENSSAISTLTRLLQTPYSSWLYGPTAITSAHLRLDPLWDPLRCRSRFPKALRGKQAVTRSGSIGRGVSPATRA